MRSTTMTALGALVIVSTTVSAVDIASAKKLAPCTSVSITTSGDISVAGAKMMLENPPRRHWRRPSRKGQAM